MSLQLPDVGDDKNIIGTRSHSKLLIDASFKLIMCNAAVYGIQ